MRVELGPGVASLIGPNGAGKTNLLEALYFAPHRALVPDLRPPRPDPVRRPARPRRGDGPRRRWRRAPAAGLGQPRRGAAPPPRRQPRRRRDGGPAPPPGRGLLARQAGAGKGPARRAAGARRPLRRRPLALAGRAPGPLRPGARPAQRSARPRPRRAAASSTSGTGPSPTPPPPSPPPATRRWRTSPRGSPPPPPSSGSRARRELEYAPRSPGTGEEIRAGLLERREADLRLGRTSWGPHLDEVKISGRRPGAAPVRLPGPAADAPFSPFSSPSARRSPRRAG